MEKASPRGEAFAAVWLRMDGSVAVEEIEQGFLDGPLKDAGKRGGVGRPKNKTEASLRTSAHTGVAIPWIFMETELE